MRVPAAFPRRSPVIATLVLAAGLTACSRPPALRTDTVEVRMVAHAAAWQASYVLAPQGNGAATEVPTGREVHVPIGAEVRFALTSLDYISDFTLPGLGLRDFCAPGLPSEIRFTADRAGRFALRGDQLCGLPHTDRSRGWLIVEDATAFRSWVERRARGVTG